MVSWAQENHLKAQKEHSAPLEPAGSALRFYKDPGPPGPKDRN